MNASSSARVRGRSRARSAGIVVATCVVLSAPVARTVGAPSYEDHAPLLRLIAPSEAVVGETIQVGAWVGARWVREGPEVPTAGVTSEVRLDVSATDPDAELMSLLTISPAQQGRATIDVTFRTPGLQRVHAVGPGMLAGTTSPIRVLAAPPAERIYWGDLHGHLHTPGAGHAGRLPAAEYERILREGLVFARATSRLDFAAFSPHLQTAGGLAHPGADGRSPWDALLAAVSAANAPGEFVVFPAFEWQGNAGDHLVIYPGPGALEAPASFESLCRSVRRRGALLTAHAVYLPSEFTQGASDLAGVEVMRDSHDTEWLGIAAIERGVVAAFLGCSDTHGGALGATSLTGLRAPSLTADNVFAAIRARRTWATNGERIVLDFSADTSAATPRLQVRGVGTAPIERIELRRNGQLIRDEHSFGDDPEFAFSWEDAEVLRPEFAAGRAIYHVRVVQTSTNRYDPTLRDVAISSPVAVTIHASERPAEGAPAPPSPRGEVSFAAETPRGRELREAFERNWGYTEPTALLAGSERRGSRAAPGRVTAFRRGASVVARATVQVEDGPVVVEIARADGRAAPVWAGRLEPGRQDVVLPPGSIKAADTLELRWGFTGWRRECGVIVPGHREARALGFAALDDGRAVLALSDTLRIVDPASGSIRSIAYPPGKVHEAGREFCVADLGTGHIVVRGADGPGGGWAADLDLREERWSDVASGPETGTIATAGSVAPGGPRDLVWLAGQTFHRRSNGRTTTMAVAVPGRLLGVAASGEMIVRRPQGDALRLSAGGSLRDRFAGPVLAADPAGVALVLAGLSARHAELSLAIRLSRVLPGGDVDGPFPVDLRASPVASPPVAAAFTPTGALLLLGGSDTWRREPDHDWWGAAVERWQPTWSDTLRAR